MRVPALALALLLLSCGGADRGSGDSGPPDAHNGCGDCDAPLPPDAAIPDAQVGCGDCDAPLPPDAAVYPPDAATP